VLVHILTTINCENPLVSQVFIIKNGLKDDGIQNCNGDNDKTVRDITVI
jgi:hypothetical protein